jgi:PhzF family phenazine biosynthesis protein
MKRKVIVYQVDSFTREQFKGNPAGVVPYADGLGEKQMQQIAREMNNSETSFLFSPDDNSCDGIIRYFTPRKEVPTCGHATIAAMYVKAVIENLDSSVFKYKTRIGVLPFEIIKISNDYKIIMTQGKPEFTEPFEEQMKTRIVSALNLSSDDLDKRCPIQIVSTGHSKVMIGIKSRTMLNELNPNYFELAEISNIISCNGYFVFTFDSDSPHILTHGRMFAPVIGINEDPVTGNANGPLGAYIVKHKLLPISGNEFSFIGKQGEAINRPGEIEVNVNIENGETVQVRIGGNAVIVFKTEIEV